MVDFDEYSRQAVHFFSTAVTPLLREVAEKSPDHSTVVDYGCGDGHLIWTLRHNGLLDRAGQVIGLDISDIRLQRFRKNTGFHTLLHAPDTALPLADDSIDLLLSTMVIEHAPDDQWMADQIARVLKPGGRVCLTTVVKRNWTWYFRRSPDGRWVLDPTHVREYGSRDEVEHLIVQSGLRIEQVALKLLAFPVIHPIIRVINSWWPLRGVNMLFINSRAMRLLEKLVLPIPGYYSIEVIAVKPSG